KFAGQRRGARVPRLQLPAAPPGSSDATAFCEPLHRLGAQTVRLRSPDKVGGHTAESWLVRSAVVRSLDHLRFQYPTSRRLFRCRLGWWRPSRPQLFVDRKAGLRAVVALQDTDVDHRRLCFLLL